MTAVCRESVAPRFLDALIDEQDRSAAEQAYTVSAFDYESAPVGSRDWMLFWKGWKAAKSDAATLAGVGL